MYAFGPKGPPTTNIAIGSRLRATSMFVRILILTFRGNRRWWAMRPPWMAGVSEMQEHFPTAPYIGVIQIGLVASSRASRNFKACSRLSPHMLCTGRKPIHTCGRSGLPKIRHRLSSSSCTHRTPAGLPFGMPGIGDEMDGAIQHAPQPGRQLNMD